MVKNARHVCARTLPATACMIAFALVSGCATPKPPLSRETFATDPVKVSPDSGVWDSEYGKTDGKSNLSYTFRLVRYADGFGVRATVRDDSVVTDDCRTGSVTCPSWDDDNIQCFFDGDNDRSRDSRAAGGVYYGGEYTLVANGAANSDYSSCPGGFGRDWFGTVARAERPGGGWKIEYDLRFTWRCLGRARDPLPEEDVTFGFNICVHDDDDGGRADRALYWKGNPEMPYRDESMFGTVVLRGERDKEKKHGRKKK